MFGGKVGDMGAVGFGWLLPGNPTIDMFFAQGLYYGVTPAGLTVSRASVGYASDQAGNWYQFPSGNGLAGSGNAARITNQGLLVEEARTNSIRNNSMQGAVVGTPGTLPTNWSQTQNTGLTPNVIALGNSQGIDFISIGLNGTTGAGTQNNIFFDGTTNIAVQYGQTITISFFYRLSSGSLTNVSSIQIGLPEYNSGGMQLIAHQIQIANPIGSWQRATFSVTVTQPTAAFVAPLLQFNLNTTSAIAITLDVGWPVSETNPNINSSVASATIQAGGTGGVAGAAVYQVGGGTGTAATLNVTVTAGAISAINSVANAGSYTTFPPSPAALTYVSGVGSGVTGATVNLTPVDNSASGFATSPIRTTGGAVVRASDAVTLTTVPTPTTFNPMACTVWGNFISSAAVAENGVVLGGWAAATGFNDTCYLASSGLQTSWNGIVGGVATFSIAGGAPTQSFKLAGSTATNSSNMAFNGVAFSRDTTHSPTAQPITTVAIGTAPWGPGAGNNINAYFTRFALIRNNVSDAGLQVLTT